MLSLVPRSVVKRKEKLSANNVPVAPSKAFRLSDEDGAGSRKSNDDIPSEPALKLLLSLITVHLTDCLISDDFRVKLRTPQGSTVATALSKLSSLYRVRLSTAKVSQAGRPARDSTSVDPSNHQNYNQPRGGGYEFQFLDGQRRARIPEEELEQNSIFLENVPPRYASGKEGILRLLSDLDPIIINPTTILGIGGILPDTTADPLGRGEESQLMRHAVVVFNSKETAEFVRRAICHEESFHGNQNTLHLPRLGCIAKRIGDIQDLRLEYLGYQALVREKLNQPSSGHAKDGESVCCQPEQQQMRQEEVMTRTRDAYPHHCLIFLRNVPDNTNKTEIKAKLDFYLKGDRVDYVDWKKGQVTAYVRVERPAHASMVLEGLNNDVTDGSMKAELLVDKQEEIYWMKLPEKARPRFHA
ncbi:hypothetical protein QFC19_004789 [Naganishia cerealis]|uniref:Uncharacterized protein n=1 Tax=Naganishia cerealis TaxID=610337 RepID=A0ACC2VT34_9TREE|nr:hypothetical protein QFC19_004789 [Naganishia cerealis]